MRKLEQLLIENPREWVSLGWGMYKLRVQNSSHNTGKSGGFRIITYFVSSEDIVYLVEIYDKSLIDTIPIQELKKLFNLS